MRITGLLLVSLFFCAACTDSHDHRGKTPLVEVNGNFLYKEDLQSVLPAGLSKDDSLLFAERYIRDWAEDLLLYEKAQNNIPDNEEIEKLVGNYRRALIMHTYQQELIGQRLSNEIPEQEAVEHLEKYSFQNAVKYEYFYNKWVPLSEVLDMIPLQTEMPEEYVSKNRHVELKDTAFHYFLNVTDYRAIGEEEPYEFAMSEVKDMLVNIKQVDFMRRVKDDLYKQAIDKKKIIYNY